MKAWCIFYGQDFQRAPKSFRVSCSVSLGLQLRFLQLMWSRPPAGTGAFCSRSAGIQINTSKARIRNWKRMDCQSRVGSAKLPQGAEFNFIPLRQLLLGCKGRIERKIDSQIGATSSDANMILFCLA